MLIYLLSTAAVCSAAENLIQKPPFSDTASGVPKECPPSAFGDMERSGTWTRFQRLDSVILEIFSNTNDSVIQKEEEVKEVDLMQDIVVTPRAPRHPALGFHTRAELSHTGQEMGNTCLLDTSVR